MEEHRLESAATGSGGMSTDVTTFIQRDGAEFVCSSGWPLFCPSPQFFSALHVLWITRQPKKSKCSCVGERRLGERCHFQEKRKLKKREFETWPGFQKILDLANEFQERRVLK